jgi:hypothetical protein
VTTFSPLPVRRLPVVIDREKEEPMAQNIPVLLVGAGLIILGFAVPTVVVAVVVAARRPVPGRGAVRLIGGSLAWMLIGAAIGGLVSGLGSLALATAFPHLAPDFIVKVMLFTIGIGAGFGSVWGLVRA